MPIVVNAVNDSINKGVWFEYGGSQFLVAHSSNLKFQRVFTRLQAPHRTKIEKGTLDPEISRKIMCEAFSQAIVLDWKDVIDASGADVPFTKEMACEALANNPDLLEYIQEVSSNLANFRNDEVESLGKN